MKKTLRFLAAAAALTFGVNSNAQLQDGSIAPDFTVTDLGGTQHNLYTYLDQGKTVVIDLFAVWCQPCWNYHQQHALEDLWTSYGPGGTDEVVVIAIESDAQEPASDITGGGNSIGDWTQGISYPIANDDNIAGLYELAYYPTIYMICPDRIVTEVGQQSTAAHYSDVQGCGSLATDANDPRMILNSTSQYFCNGSAKTITAWMQNYGTSNLTSCTIEAIQGGNTIATLNWTGSLAPYEGEEVTVGSPVLSAGTPITIKITSTNDNTNNDEVTATVTAAPVLEYDPAYGVGLDASIDNYASEFGFIYGEGNPPTEDLVALHNGVANSTYTSLGFIQVGSFTDGTNTISETYTVNNPGCHYFAFVDSYGDGVDFQTPGAYVHILGDANGVNQYDVDPAYGDGVMVMLDLQVSQNVSVDENEIISDLTVFPNPATDNVNIRFNSVNAENTSIEVVNNLGQVVYTEYVGNISGEQTHQLNVSGLENGIYIVNIKSDNNMTTKMLSVQK